MQTPLERFFPLFVCCFVALSCRENVRKETTFTARGLEADLERTFHADRTYEHARYFTQFWRIAGSPAFDSCVNYVTNTLKEAGFVDGVDLPENGPGFITVMSDSTDQEIWIPHDARLSLITPEKLLLLDFSVTPVMLCSNSYPQRITAPLVSIRGGGKESDFEGRDVKGSIVLCDDNPSEAWGHAVRRRALGVISSFVPAYNAPERFPDIIADGAIPRSDSIRSFGMKVSPKIGGDLRAKTEYTAVRVSVEIEASFVRAPIKTTIAVIPGTVKPQERVLFAAHLDHYKPGANDNASGAATLLEIAATISHLIRSGSVPRPPRTLTFLWVDEYNGTRFWMKRHREELQNIQAVFVLDMVGADPDKTGGMFRVEKMPDPAVLWFRPPDVHSGWGVGSWDREKLFGNYLNDFMLSVVQRRSLRTGWKTGTNVWEGGSDHDPFLLEGIPAILSWHFPDPFYHSSLDRLENLSSEEMKQSGVSIALAGFVPAFGNNTSAGEILSLLVRAAGTRLDQIQAGTVIELGDAQRENLEVLKATRQQERDILEAWTRWYLEAFDSVLRIPVEGPSRTLRERVSQESQRLREKMETMLLALDLK